MENTNNTPQNANNRNFQSSLSKEELETVIMNVCDGLWSTNKPIDDPCMLSDMDTRMEIFDYMMEGVTSNSEHNVVEHDTMVNMSIFWGTIKQTMQDAMALLEYVYRAKRSEDVSLDNWNDLNFPGSDIADRIKEKRERSGR